MIRKIRSPLMALRTGEEGHIFNDAQHWKVDLPTEIYFLSDILKNKDN